MKYRLSVRDLAEQDLTEAVDFYEAQREGLGRDFHDEVALQLRNIERNPLLYPVSEVPTVHKAALKVFPFCIYYQVHDRAVMIIAVHDSRRNPKRWKGRVKS
jgi:plasmid stabilization system protein ParE